MSARKQYLKPSGKASKKKPLLPETENEYLAAGVKEEEAGEKWRAGDAAKSCRFFLRAIELYDSGLKRYPSSFDLAYNKARLQFDISQQPRLLPYQPLALVELLFVALDSHRYALNLESDNADVLFNTAQVMVSIAESLIDTATVVGTHDRGDATPLLLEAIKTFQRCLEVQWKQFRESENIALEAEQPSTEIESSPPPKSTAGSDEEERWASVEETVTSSTLLDSCLAEVHAWSILLPLLDQDKTIYVEIELKALESLERAKDFPNSQEESIAYQQATFNLKSALADYAYRCGLISSIDYANAVSEVWSASNAIITYGPCLCDHADALITLSTTISSNNTPEAKDVRWQALSAALKSLSQANTTPGSADRVAINGRRGDVELLRARMADAPNFFEQAVKHKDVLVKNSETYYEGARKLAQSNSDQTTADIMLAKSIIAKALREGNMTEILDKLPAADQAKMHTVIGEMAEEGLFPPYSR